MKGINLGEPPIVLGEKKLRVELDKKALFALASDTRLEILKALQSERRTVSQLAETLGVDKAAVYRHLKKLEEGDFVKREDDHGFVYYRLSWKARDIISPGENTRIIVLISASVALLMVAALILFAMSSSGGAPYFEPQEADNSVQRHRWPGPPIWRNGGHLIIVMAGRGTGRADGAAAPLLGGLDRLEAEAGGPPAGRPPGPTWSRP